MTGFPYLHALVVDDDPFARDLIQATLEHLQLGSITTVGSGEEAMVSLADPQSQTNILLCDLHMPGMDGVELLRHLGENQFDGGIILISGAEESILRAAVSLARAYFLNLLGSLQKPATAKTLAYFLRNYNQAYADRVAVPRAASLTPQELESGLEDNALILYYQPQIDIDSGRVVGVEALARWQHPQHGLLPPSAFIAVAEHNGSILPFTEQVLDQAMAQAARWKNLYPPFRMAINLSTVSLCQRQLPQMLVHGCERHGLDPQDITLEVTETHLDQNKLLSLEVLTRIRLNGFGLSIDDFGTGYSSLDRLKNAPFDELKIDGGFVHGAMHDKAAQAILESSIVLGKQLALSVLAEGVEDEEDWALVKRLGCDIVQGFFIARPMPADSFEQWLTQWQGLESLPES